MKPGADWSAVWEAFHGAMDVPPERRFAFIEQADLGPAEREEVRSLLHSEAAMDDFLAHPADGSPTAIAGRPGDEDWDDDDAHDPLIGQAIGRYTVLRRIGRGGMGIVYEAEQCQPRRRVALKLLRADLISRRALRRFTAEADILARLKHPFIARVHDAGTFDQGEGGRPYFAMELVTGDPITVFAQRHGLSSRGRLALLADVCDAVHHAHQRGVIHRDLKPGNVLVEHIDGRPRPKVLDFGVARVLDVEAAATTLTGRSEIVGTLPYMSPEQIDGRSDIGALTDVYALGVLLHEVLAERLPYDFGAGSMLDAMQAIREQRPRAMSAIHRRWRGEIETIVAKALEKEPERRYQSAAALADDLRRFLRGEPILARPASRVYHLRTFVRRNRALTIAACAAAMILIAGAAVSTWQAVRARTAEAIAVERFEDVRGLAKTVIFELEPALARIPGATPARRLLVDTALDYLETLEQSADNDPVLLHELALAYERLGDVQGNVVFSNVGDYAGAHELYGRSLAIWERLLANAPERVDLRHTRARLVLRSAETHPDPGSIRYPNDNNVADRPLQLLEALARAHPTPEIRRDLALACERKAIHLSTRQEYAAALALFDRAITILRSIRSHPDWSDADATRLADALSKNITFRSRMLRLMGKVPEALASIDESITVADEARLDAPLDTSLAKAESSASFERARVLMDLNRHEDALASAQNTLAIVESMLRSDETNMRTFRWYGVAHAQLADLYADAGANDAMPTDTRLTYWRKALRLHTIAHEHTIERDRRGWLREWESHYIEDGERAIAACETVIAELTARTAPALSAGR